MIYSKGDKVRFVNEPDSEDYGEVLNVNDGHVGTYVLVKRYRVKHSLTSHGWYSDQELKKEDN